MGLSTTFWRLPSTTRKIVKSKPQVDGLLIFKKDPHGRPMRVKRSRWLVFVARRNRNVTKGPPRCRIDTLPDFSRLRNHLCRLTCGILQTSIGEGYAQLNLPIGPVLFGPLSVSGGNMNRRHVNAAITAGLALTMTVGSVPPQAFAEMMQGDTTQVVAEQSKSLPSKAMRRVRLPRLRTPVRQPRKTRVKTRSPLLPA